jgi:type VI secretion system protein ImpL
MIGPAIMIGAARPLASVGVRLTVIIVLLLVVGGYAAWKWHQRRQAAKALEDGIAKTAEASDDAVVLSEKMRDALATLRQAGGRDYLYDLPWYIIIGPPGAGKTTALVNSGLKFPLARGNNKAFIEGVGGTRYCDWWFTEEAVLIDTAGRYTTQDSDAKADRQSWLAFLDLLRRNRTRQPINGVLIAISLEDLMKLPPEEINQHADAIRARLRELHERLKVEFPVYALFTKADLVAGFMECFGDMKEADRRAVWGATFQTRERRRNMVNEAPNEFDALIERLNDNITDHLQEQPSHTARVLLFGFPDQMMALKKPVTDFLARVFESTRYQQTATLRGFYFTSGTQQGTPFDQLLGAMSRAFASEPAGYSGLGKSFFLTDLLKKVIIGEAGWVSVNRGATRRAWALRIAAYVALALVSAGLIGLWSVSFFQNRQLIADANSAVGEYRTRAAALLTQTSINDHDLGKVLQQLLHPLRYMPAGYAERDAPVSLKETFGLGQRGRIHAASETAYRRVLERTFRSRLLVRLEDQIKAHIEDPGYLYDALKVYLMLGGQAKSDDELIVAWMRQDWEQNLYPGAGNRKGREALEEHLRAMLELDAGQTTTLGLNGPLVEEAQKTLARMSVAQRAYALLKSQAAKAGYRDWVAAERGGPDLAAVFESAGGEGLDQVRVPGFFTYQGFQKGFLGGLPDIAKRVQSEQWVLGEVGEHASLSAQYETLPYDLLALYNRDFIAAWQAALEELRLRPMTADKPRYVALAAASGEISPIRELLKSIREETMLTVDPPKEEAAPAEDAAPTVVSAEPTLNAEPEPEAEASGDLFGLTPMEHPGATIEAYFTPLHMLVTGTPGQQPIEQLISELGAIRQNLVISAVSPMQAPQANAELPAQITNLRTTASRLPSPLAEMITAAADDIEADITGAAITGLSQAFDGQVTQACEQVVPGRYPFEANSDRDVPLQDFARLFGPSGLINTFFEQNLARLVDTAGGEWRWRDDSLLAKGMSEGTLKQFQRAAEIRDAFFPNGGDTPSITFTVTPVSLSGADSSVLKINATTIESDATTTTPSAAEWPGPSPDNHAAIALRGGFFGTVSILERKGPWAFFHLLDAGTVLKRGDGLLASFVIDGNEVSYEFAMNSITNPVLLPALREFRCPAGL